nr:hypothetical protein [Microseira wollei]
MWSIVGRSLSIYLRYRSIWRECNPRASDLKTARSPNGDRKISLKLSDTALDFLAEVGYDPVFGARPLKRAIQRELETQIAKAILRGEFSEGDTVFVDVQNERLAFKRLPSEVLTIQSS